MRCVSGLPGSDSGKSDRLRTLIVLYALAPYNIVTFEPIARVYKRHTTGRMRPPGYLGVLDDFLVKRQ